MGFKVTKVQKQIQLKQMSRGDFADESTKHIFGRNEFFKDR